MYAETRFPKFDDSVSETRIRRYNYYLIQRSSPKTCLEQRLAEFGNIKEIDFMHSSDDRRDFRS